MKSQATTPSVNASPLSEHKRMLKLTFPILKGRLKRHKLALVILAILSLMLGVVPTLKSELEAALVQQINTAVGPAGNSEPRSAPAKTSPESLREIVSLPLERFAGESSPQDGIPERLARSIFRNANLGMAVLGYFLIVAVVFGVELWSKALQARVSKDLFAKLRSEGMRRGLLTDPSALPAFRNIAGQYAVAIQQGAINVGDTYGYMLDAGQHIFALTTTIVLIATKSWVFALLALALVLAQVAISVRQARKLAEERTKLDRTRNELVGRSENILSKREILLAYEQQDRYGRTLDSITKEYAEVERKLAVSEQKYNGFSQLLTDYGRISILLLALGLALFFAGSAVSNIGDAFFLITIYARIFVPSSNLLMRYDSIKRSEATSKTFLDVIQFGPQASSESNVDAKPVWQKGQDILFSHVSFKYDATAKTDVLNDCTFRIPAGKTTLILGPSGAGKTTIARLLLKFWPVDRGSVSLGGGDLNQFNGEEVRAQMSYVSQGDHIVDDSVEDNLSWGFSKDGISQQRMRETLAKVGIVTPHGYSDILIVPAEKLSMGQKQRLSIARMMLDESEIVIMDEPLAGVDVFTIHELLPHLTTLLRDGKRTVIMISHRLAFAGCSDHVVILNADGKIVEEGEPRQLADDADSVFAGLHKASEAELILSKAKLDTLQSESTAPAPSKGEPSKA
jgi:ABC-type multidrug transport system fused ATPase/permease subunit